MRIISQNGMNKIFDFPYERSIVYILPNDNSIRLQPIGEVDSDYVVAKYSTKEKAKKAMEMLHENYGRLCNVKVLASGSAKHMEESFSGNKLNEIIGEYQEMNIFHFPTDEVVEV